MTQPNHVIFFFRIYNVEEDNALDDDFASDNDSKSDDDNNLTNMFFEEESEYIEVTVEDEGDYDVTNMFKEEIAFLRKSLRTLRSLLRMRRTMTMLLLWTMIQNQMMITISQICLPRKNPRSVEEEDDLGVANMFKEKLVMTIC
ncbi:hypothetical protein LWI28_029052 [Acer negundo]|uniref:Uncharacterized protein n=1 Tax=Acer negundo TaxID=4023 RepID=A0AAD5J2V2_ACENE|nr:hypothetical protein LWI28_029052 [Acer negundo]